MNILNKRYCRKSIIFFYADFKQSPIYKMGSHILRHTICCSKTMSQRMSHLAHNHICSKAAQKSQSNQSQTWYGLPVHIHLIIRPFLTCPLSLMQVTSASTIQQMENDFSYRKCDIANDKRSCRFTHLMKLHEV